MEYARRLTTGVYIFISVFLLFFLGGCMPWHWDKGDHRCADRQAGTNNTGQHEKNCEEYH